MASASKGAAFVTRPARGVNPTRRNAGVEAAYRDRLTALIAMMHRQVAAEILAVYGRERREFAEDASAATVLREAMSKLARRWIAHFNDLAATMARGFVFESGKAADTSLRHALRKGGMTVEFRLTRGINNVLQAAVGENVALIRSIPQQYLTQIEGIVLRSAQVGRDAQTISRELQHQFGVSKRRAAFIARDQSNKATAVVVRERQRELGITEAVWMHSGGGKKPRPEHVRANGKRYEIEKGMYLEGKWTWPGHEINCRCVSRSIVPGLT